MVKLCTKLDLLMSRVLEGSSTQSGSRPRPFLICRSTGGGKSACRNILGFIQGDVTLMIVPLLSLGADQTAKLQSLSDSNQSPVQVYHLDQHRARDANRFLCRLINELTDATVTIFLFASPQKLLSREWYDCIGSLIKQQSVPFSLCVDECHLYAQFGAEFHAKFHGIKALLFAPICRYPPMMPIMFLTATASTTVLDDLEDLTGLSFDRTELLWSAAPTRLRGHRYALLSNPAKAIVTSEGGYPAALW
jgi:superfamily II DNA helicase RecQ